MSFELPVEPAPDSAHSAVDTPGFGFNSQIDIAGSTATALFRYWTKADHIDPGDFDAHRDGAAQMATACAQVLDLDPKPARPEALPDQPTKPEKPRPRTRPPQPAPVNRKAVVAVAIGAALIAWLAFDKLSGKGDTPPPRVSDRPGSAAGPAGASDFVSPSLGDLDGVFDDDFAAKDRRAAESATFDGADFSGSLLDSDPPGDGSQRGIQKVGDRELIDLDLRP